MPIEDVSKKWGTSFVDTVRWMRGLGYTWRTIARLLEIPFDTLRRWKKVYGVDDGKYNREAPHSQPSQERAKELGYADLTDMMREYRYAGKTRKDLANDLGINSSDALDKAAPKELAGEYEVTERLRRIRRKNANSVNRRGLNKRKEDR